MDQWYFERDGAPAGPVSFDELQRLAGSGVLARDTRIWSEGMGDWVAASTVERLWAGAAASAPAVAFASGPAPAGPFAAAPAPAYAAPLAADLGLNTAAHGLAMTSGVDMDALVGNMRFVGILNVIWGALSCLSLIYIPIGVPLIIMGLRLRESADQFEGWARSGNQAALTAALEKQNTFFKIQKIMFIIGIVLAAVLMLFFFVGAGASMIGR